MRGRKPRATEGFDQEHFTGRFPQVAAFAAYRLGGKNPYPGAFDARIILFSAALLPSSRG